MDVDDPMLKFAALFEQAKAAQPVDPNAMVLSTVDDRGRPSSRVVLLKAFDATGFSFYTNLDSRKGRELKAHPYAALCFHWHPLQKQVRIEGAVEHVSDSEADSYFATRPRESQVGAWASQQSGPLSSRQELEKRVKEISERFPGPVPRPPFWSGFRVVPDRIEFWTAKPGRLHERVLFVKSGAAWTQQLLYP